MAQQYIESLKGLTERKLYRFMDLSEEDFENFYKSLGYFILVVPARIVDERWLLSPKRIGNPTTRLGDLESRNVRKKRPSKAFSFTDEPGPSEFNFD